MLAVLSATLAFSASSPTTVETARRVTLEPAVSPYNASASSWAFHSTPPAEQMIKLTTVLRIDESRLALLEQTLYQVSDPTHPAYGQHKSHAELAALLAVPQRRVDLVVDFWRRSGAAAVELHPTRDTLTVAISVAEHVTMVGELHQFPRPRVLQAAPSASKQSVASWPNSCKSSACANAVTPSVLAARYNFPATQTAVAGNSMAVAEFQGQYYKPDDLAYFNSHCGADAAVAHQIGGNVPSAGVEAELDVEYTSVSGVAGATAQQITSLTSPPLVHSVSYGNDEAQQTSKEYMLSVNTALMKAGTMGLSILFASGDQGVCGREGCGFLFHKFHPDFPAGSPYVTAVGGTDFATAGVIGDEKAWTDGGGGFSDTFAMPSYQQAAVSAYLSSAEANLPKASLFNAKGRGYPDVAALAGTQNPYCVVTSGGFEGVGGTSAASPVVAAIFARLNGLRLAKGGKPLGFLNPFIYQNAAAFNDVKQGVNTGGGGAGGFQAIGGWDAATGVGTPDYGKLAQLV
ncbi:hypothetical protein AB1Y20_013647 [Prymnesium parvum]|uniref:Peptidase S53 domain-containing protein n=1 Tax=Prymnesium parvum TaxID=97485 RepID=A0AB34IJK9_PRYPA